MAADSKPAKGDGRKRGGLVKIALEFLIVTVIAASAGAVFALPPRPETPRPAEDPAGWADGATLVDLPPIVTNLGAPSDTWVRLEASIVMDANFAAKRDVIAGEIATDFLAYMRTVTLDQLEGPVGLQNLRHDLAERASTRSGAKVTEVILKTLVLQ